MKQRHMARRRPAETAAGVAGALAALIAYIFKIDEPGVVAALAVVLGALPAAVTWAITAFVSDRERRRVA